jgi:hypothetical protein
MVAGYEGTDLSRTCRDGTSSGWDHTWLSVIDCRSCSAALGKLSGSSGLASIRVVWQVESGFYWWFECHILNSHPNYITHNGKSTDPSWLGLARTVYMHRIWPYIWWFPCQKHRIYTVYIWFWPTLLMVFACLLLSDSSQMEGEVYAFYNFRVT